MGVRFGVRGSRELASSLRQLAAAPSDGDRRQARTKAARVLAESYRANLRANGSEETGALVASVGVGEDDEQRNRTLVGARKGTFKKRRPSSYAHFPEFGTAPHWQPNRFGGIMHPGARPKPALRPALQQSTMLASKVYFDSIAASIQVAAARIASRAGRARR